MKKTTMVACTMWIMGASAAGCLAPAGGEDPALRADVSTQSAALDLRPDCVVNIVRGSAEPAVICHGGGGGGSSSSGSGSGGSGSSSGSSSGGAPHSQPVITSAACNLIASRTTPVTYYANVVVFLQNQGSTASTPTTPLAEVVEATSTLTSTSPLPPATSTISLAAGATESLDYGFWTNCTQAACPFHFIMNQGEVSGTCYCAFGADATGHCLPQPL